MPTQTFQIVCPCFPGFYESYLSFGADEEQDYIDRLAETYNVPHGVLDKYFEDHELDFNNSEYETAVGKEFMDQMIALLECYLPGIEGYAFIRISSPAYYNFETDKVIMNISLDPKKVIDECHVHYEEFAEYLDKNLSPRDGFIPYFGTNPEWWLDADNWDDHDPIVLGTILEFILRAHVEDPVWELSQATMEQIDFDDYITLPKEVYEIIDEYAS